MKVENIKELQSYLESLGTRPKKSLGQNFLVDNNILDKIINTADIRPGEVVLEIGPGPGALTEKLLEAGATVIAVEKDKLFARGLQRLEGSLKIVNDDIMETDLTSLLPKGAPVKVVANIPYNLTTPIIEKLLLHSDSFSSIILMVQNEVALRCTAPPNTSEYSSLTIFLGFYSQVDYAFKVGRKCFLPPPKVDSAIIRLVLRNPPLPQKLHQDFFMLTRTAFQQKRKMLRSSLRKIYSPKQVMEALESIGCSPQARPQELSLRSFTALFLELIKS
ncbi:MAG: 16S rRNA (adenine(1518)-N(6)/adenine(1519)-N(6))-dimethyltransferase RsmA [Chlamydiota bacterium]